jgi:N-succinyldiaminopimelate aminotransferase
MVPHRQACRWADFGKSIFSTYTQEAARHGAVNLAQGFPDFPGPAALIGHIQDALREGSNQYAPGSGVQRLREIVAEIERLGWSPTRVNQSEREWIPSAGEILITAGATEGLFCTLVGIVNPGERVLSFEPFYESYRQCTEAAGGCFETIHLSSPDEPSALSGRWRINWEHFEQMTREPFRAFVVNTPHNPTGIVLGCEEWERILEACRRHGAAVVSDEVYENLVYQPFEHLSVLDVARKSDWVIKVSSVSKSLGYTGLKIGWVVGNEASLEGPAKVHEATLFCVAPALQEGVARFLEHREMVGQVLAEQLTQYTAKKQKLFDGLVRAGFDVAPAPSGSYFLTADGSHLSRDGSVTDRELAAELISRFGVAALPLSGFCRPCGTEATKGSTRMATALADHPLHRGHWLRFSFCKQDAVLEAALSRLSKV